MRSLIQEAQQHIVRNVNTTMLITYFEIGRMIVEHEQKGNLRAGYSEGTLIQLSQYLTKEFGRGYSRSSLEYMPSFYATYENRISQSVIGKFKNSPKSASPMRKFGISQPAIGKSQFPFLLSWTHYIQLLKIENEAERNFYEIEAAQNHWSVRELQRQYNSAIYERVALSKNKKGVKQLAKKGQIIEKPVDALKSHYVLEFLNLKEDSHYSESDLETAIINKLEHFMLELGKGFCLMGAKSALLLREIAFLLTWYFTTVC